MSCWSVLLGLGEGRGGQWPNRSARTTGSPGQKERSGGRELKSMTRGTEKDSESRYSNSLTSESPKKNRLTNESTKL